MSSSYKFLLFFVLTASTFATGFGLAEKVLLHFYSVNLTLATVSSLAKSNNSASFGNLNVIYSPLTEVPESSSQSIGTVQGMVVGTSLANPMLLTTMNFVFTDGQYKGSSLAVYGREVLGVPSERTIVGGSGHFRLARGVLESKVYSSTATSLIVEFHALLLVRKH